MKIRFLLLMLAMVLFFVIPSLSFAVPANPSLTQLQQPDGSIFDVQIVGDEWDNRIETAGGFTIDKAPDGTWRHVTGYAEEKAKMSGTLAHTTPPAGLKKHIQMRSKAARLNLPAGRSGSAQKGVPSTVPQTAQFINFNGPVLFILAEHGDRLGTTSEASWGSFVTNNIADYFSQASYGRTNLVPATETSGISDNGVIGWVNIGLNHPNTGGTIDTRNQQITKDAIIAADPFIDYSSYDTNADGFVDSDELAIVVVVAGFERAYSPSFTPSVWGHKWSIFLGAPTVDSVIVGGFHGGLGGYAQFGEIHQSTNLNQHQATMGIMVHELGHLIFGLPDLYDIDSSSSGIGAWGVMGRGSWGNSFTDLYAGETPVLPTAWTKLTLGWVDDLEGNGVEGLTAAGDATANSSNSVRKSSTPTATQYFLTENRQPVGYDLGLEGLLGSGFGGVAIWHIDETQTTNANDVSRWVDLEEANGVQMGPSSGIPTNLWLQGNATTFDDTTNPDTKLNNGTASGVAINSISVAGTVMTANFGGIVSGGILTVSPATNLTPSGLEGGPFTPASQGYTLSNTGSASINYSATNLAGWVDVSNLSGTLNPGANTLVTVSINGTANSLIEAVYNDTVTFANTTNGNGNTTRNVHLTVQSSTLLADTFGHSGGGIPQNFGDISSTGTPVFLADDEISGIIPIPFAFNFYGNTHTSLQISSNGFIQFPVATGDGCCQGLPIPQADAVNNIIALLWNDLNPSAGGTIRYQTLGTAPNREFVVGFYEIPYSNSLTNVTVEAILHEGTNDIEWQFGSASASGAAPSTVGIENDTGTDGLQFLNGDSDMSYQAFLITHLGANQPPTADAGPDQTVPQTGASGANVTLDGSLSSDPDSDPLIFSWTGIFGTASGATPTVLIPVGTHTVTLVVNDGTIDSAPATMTVTVVASANSINSRNDFDGDGDSDLLGVNDDGSVAVVLLENSVLQTAGVLLNADPLQGWTVHATADFDGDGKKDVLLFNTTTGDYRVVLVDGLTVILDTVVHTINPALGLEPRGVGDFDGDGSAEIIIYNPATGSTELMYLNAGVFDRLDFVTNIDVGNSVTLKETGDFNQDGKTDLITYNTVTGDIAIILMNGSIPALPVAIFTLPLGFALADMADYDGDGKTDILATESATGLVGVALMDGLIFQSAYAPVTLPTGIVLINNGKYDADGKADLLVINNANGELFTVIQDGTVATAANSVLTLGTASGWTFHKGKP